MRMAGGLLAILFGLTAALVVQAQFERPRKKLIEYGWDAPYPDFVRAHIREMEKKPFDGIVVRLRGGWKVFLKRPYEPRKFEADIENLRAIKWGKFTDNFVVMWATSEEGWDWFDESDWRAAERNVRLIARAAKAGGCVGICFDPEPYGPNPWAYKGTERERRAPFERYFEQVRRRGAQFMRAIQEELPGARILTFFQGSLFGGLVDEPDPKERMRKLSSHHYALLPAFLNGMLDAIEPGSLIIDGNEPAYYYSSPEQYFRAYHLMKQRALSLIAPENRRKYALHVQAGFALYIDYVFALGPVWGRRSLARFLKPEERAKWFEHNVYWALYTTDEYVWCYSERMNWWQNKGIPAGAEEAIRSAREKVERGRPPGFDIEGIIERARERQRAEIEKRLVRRTAKVYKLGPSDEPPKIDGSLDDPIWRKVEPLQPFLPPASEEKEKPEAGTKVWVAYDDNFLYVAFFCEEPNPKGMRVVGEKRDDEVWRGDCVEVFISRGKEPKPYFHFIVNPKNVQWDGISAEEGDDKSFDARWESATKVGEREWTAELAIPWSETGGPPGRGESRRANFCRQRGATHELSTWSAVVRWFLEPENFGTLKF